MCDYGVSICLHEERAVTRTGSREYMAPVREGGAESARRGTGVAVGTDDAGHVGLKKVLG